MSTTAPLPAPGLDPTAEARGYCAAVSAELADLPADVVEELTGGLEADLAELAAESATPLLDRLGAPGAYAAELRASAGLHGPSHPPVRPGVLAAPVAAVRRDAERLGAHLRSRPWWPGAVERAVQLRPAWWVLRGALGGWVVGSVLLAEGLLALLLVLAGAALSVEVGRRGARGHWSRRLLTSGDVLAVLVLPFALGALASGPREVYVYPASTGSEAVAETAQGVWSDGQVVTNIYPYDAQGRPLTGVQLLDDYGRPLATSRGDGADWSGGAPDPLVPAVDAQGALRWNAYPLRTQAEGAGAAPTTPPLPEPSLPPLVGASQDAPAQDAPAQDAPAQGGPVQATPVPAAAAPAVPASAAPAPAAPAPAEG